MNKNLVKIIRKNLDNITYLNSLIINELIQCEDKKDEYFSILTNSLLEVPSLLNSIPVKYFLHLDEYEQKNPIFNEIFNKVDDEIKVNICEKFSRTIILETMLSIKEIDYYSEVLGIKYPLMIPNLLFIRKFYSYNELFSNYQESLDFIDKYLNFFYKYYNIMD